MTQFKKYMSDNLPFYINQSYIREFLKSFHYASIYELAEKLAAFGVLSIKHRYLYIDISIQLIKKITLILLIFFTVLSPLIAENAYSENTGAKGPLGSSVEAEGGGLIGYPVTGAKRSDSSVYVFIQMKIRNSHGDLIGYIEGKPSIFNHDELINWLEPRSQKSTIIRGGERYEIMQDVHIISYSKFDSLSAYFLREQIGGTTNYVMFFDHDSILMSPGDEVQVFWTVIRPRI